MKRRYFQTLLICFSIIIMGFLLSSCCSPAKCTYSVTFIGADERLGFKDYEETVEFDTTKYFSLDIPAGYDHNQIKLIVDDREWEYEVEYPENFDDENYEYSVDRKVIFKVHKIRKSFKIKIDLTDMQKMKFALTMDNSLNGFKAVAVNPEILEGLRVLGQNNIISEIPFTNNVAYVEYGVNIFLVRENNSIFQQGLYSDVNHFTEDKFKANLGTLQYSFYPKAVRGNTNYLYNNQNNTSIFYFGEVKENVNFYSQIPNYIPDKGFEIDRVPNIFYLFTNLAEYNGELLTTEPYYPTTLSYSASNPDLDKVDNITIAKATPAYTYIDRYDVYQIYLGDDIENDPLINNEIKAKTYTDMYIKISSDMPVDELKISLLNYEYESDTNALKLSPNIESIRGEKYIHITRENMMQYSNERDEIINGNVRNFHSGSAILSVSAKDYVLREDTHTGKYRYAILYIQKGILAADTSFATVNDFHIMIYVKNCDQRKYGFVDYHSEPNSYSKRDVVYLLREDIFDEEGKYKNNVYMEVRGANYENFQTLTIDQVYFYEKQFINNSEAVRCQNYREYNGVEYRYRLDDNRLQWSFDLFAEINVNNLVSSYQYLDFSNVELPNTFNEGIYITNNYLFESVDNFNFVFCNNKDHVDNFYINYHNDIYYFTKINGNKNSNIELRLDASDPTSCVSSTTYLEDMVGNRFIMEIMGEPYYIKVLKLNHMFEINANNKIYVVRT